MNSRRRSGRRVIGSWIDGLNKCSLSTAEIEDREHSRGVLSHWMSVRRDRILCLLKNPESLVACVVLFQRSTGSAGRRGASKGATHPTQLGIDDQHGRFSVSAEEEIQKEKAGANASLPNEANFKQTGSA